MSGRPIVARRAWWVVMVILPSWLPGRPRCRDGRTPFEHDGLVRRDIDPRSHDAVGPGHPDPGRRRRTQTDVDRDQLAPGVSAADGELAMRRHPSDLDVEPRSDRIAVGSGLTRLDADPVSHLARSGRRPGSHVSPDPDRIAEVPHDEIEHAVAVEVDERRPS